MASQKNSNWFSNFIRKGGHKNLTLQILVAIIAAFAFALTAPHAAEYLHFGGEIFLNLLKMMVVPLVVTSVMSGILGMGDVRKLGKPGATAIGYYLCTTVIAVLIGLVVVNTLQPGNAMDPAAVEQAKEEGAGKQAAQKKIVSFISEGSDVKAEEMRKVFGFEGHEPQTTWDIVQNLFTMLVTDNLFAAAMEMELLPLIVFSIIFAAVLTTMGKQVEPLRELIVQGNEALMKVILLFMHIAPLGIFCLVAARFGEAEAEGQFLALLKQLGGFFITVVVGLGIHFFIVLPAILWFMTKRNPFKFMAAMGQAILTAFSTASSSGTLPITMNCAINKANVSRKSTEFVLPLGATINMDGTALYEAAAVLFIAQALGMDLTLGQQAIVAVTATLAAIGAAGIPEAGLITMMIVLRAVGLPTELVVMILPIDWLLDRFRTATNVFGDSVGAAVVQTAMPKESKAT